jgi:hypothetical protein
MDAGGRATQGAVAEGKFKCRFISYVLYNSVKGERNYKHTHLIVGWISEAHPPSSAIGGCASLIHPTSYINKWYFSNFLIPKSLIIA